MSSPDVDVAIVGAGPVGLALAVLLGQRGRTVTVLERQPSHYVLPRAVHLDHEAARIVQACGLGPTFAAMSEPAEIYEWRNAAGRTLLRFGRVGHGLSGWPESSMFTQPELEAALGERAVSVPGVSVRRGAEVVGIDEGEGEPVVVRLADGAAVSARWVVGCDGANSTVRRLAGIEFVDLGFFYDWLIVDVVLAEPRVFDPVNLQVCDPKRPTTLVSGGPGRRRWEFMALPGEDLAALATMESAWSLLAPHDVRPDNARIERSATYRFQARWVEEWRKGAVLLAGDAAHQMPPFAGQGLCSGLRDAANLAWKLDLVMAGSAAPDLLDTYGTERAPHVKSMIELSMALGQVICVADEAEAAARDDAMAAGVVDGSLMEIPPPPSLSGPLVRVDDVAAGGLFVQGRVKADDGSLARFDDVFGAGWRLVSTAPIALDAEAAVWFASIGGAAAVVDAGRDADGTYAAWFARHGVGVALQRPDFTVFASSADPSVAGDLVTSLRARLRP